jgi:hypothetical protein
MGAHHSPPRGGVREERTQAMKKFPLHIYVNYHEGERRDPGYFVVSENEQDAVRDADDTADDRVAIYKLVTLKKARTIRKLE